MPTLYADYSDARPSPAAIKEAGYYGVIRYVAPVPNPKVITITEYVDLRLAGLDILLVWESTANRSLAGASAGAADAQAAEVQAKALGYPSDAGHPIFYATDFSPSGAQMPAVLSYYAGVRTAPRAHAWGPYGGLYVVNQVGQADAAWQTVAWSSGQISSQANLYQRLTPTLTIPGAQGAYDEDVLLKPFINPPPQKGSPVLYLMTNTEGVGFLVCISTNCAPWKMGLPDPTLTPHIAGVTPIPQGDVSDATINAIPNAV